MICLYECRENSKIYRNMCVLSHFYRKVRHHLRFDLYVVEEKCDFCLKIETAKNHEHSENETR